MAVKEITARHIQLHDVEAAWNTKTEFKPFKGEIIVYDIDDTYNYERFKIGDGKTLIKDLPFVTDNNLTDALLDKLDTAYTHSQAAHAPSNAQANQNAFSNIQVGNTTIAADNTTDTLNISAGANITLTPDTGTDTLTISATDTVYTHPTHTERTKKLYKVSVDAQGHVDDVTEVVKSDITALGIPGSDTHYASKNIVGNSATVKANTNSALTNGNVYLNSVENDVVTSSHKISGSGATTVTTDTSGNIVISSTDTNTIYSHPTHTKADSGLYKIAVDDLGHVTGATAVTKADITGLGIPAQDTTYTLGSFGITSTAEELNYTDGVTSNIQTQLNNKVNTSLVGANGGLATLDDSGKVPTSQLPSYVDDVLEFSAQSAFPAAGESGKIYVDTTTNKTYRWGGTAYAEISASLAIGTTATTAAAGNHTHNYAGSTSVGGSATSAEKLTTSAGSETQPIYFKDGKPEATTYTLGASVPSNAKFTDTTYSAASTTKEGLMSATDKAKLDGITASADSVVFAPKLTSGTEVGTITINGSDTKLYAPTNTDTHYTTGLKVGASATAKDNAAATNGNVYINLLDDTTIRDSHKIVGSGATTVISDASGIITISSTDTVYSHPSYTQKDKKLYKVNVDNTGHVSDATEVTKADITALGIPAQDTTYSNATFDKAGIVQIDRYGGIYYNDNGIAIDAATPDDLTNRVGGKFLDAGALDYIISTGVTTNTVELTEDEKTSAREWVGAIGATDYATATDAGVVKVGAGLQMTNNALTIQYATEQQIEKKQGYRNPLSPQFIDKIIKVGVTTNTITLSDNEKATACNWLGALYAGDTFVIDGGTAADVM